MAVSTEDKDFDEVEGLENLAPSPYPGIDISTDSPCGDTPLPAEVAIPVHELLDQERRKAEDQRWRDMGSPCARAADAKTKDTRTAGEKLCEVLPWDDPSEDFAASLEPPRNHPVATQVSRNWPPIVLTPEHLDELEAAGVVFPDELPGVFSVRKQKKEPWRPRTIQDVDWVGYTIAQKREEAELIRKQAERRARECEAAAKRLEFLYLAECERIVRDRLPQRDGKYTKKTLTLARTTAKLRSQPATVEIEDALEAVKWLDNVAKSGAGGTKPIKQVLLDGLRVDLPSLCGASAVAHMHELGAKVRLLIEPVKAFVVSLPPTVLKPAVVDNDSGEVLEEAATEPATIPGVRLVPACEKFYLVSAKAKDDDDA